MWRSYVRAILALQELSTRDSSRTIPLAIMTSDATHEATRKLLEDNGNFGMAEGQITLMRQAKVPALADNDARIAVEADDPYVTASYVLLGGCVLTMLSCVWCSYTIVAKPHGHGDVHGLLLKHDLVRQWSADGRRYVVFFQVCQH